jgi:hypothetical protein
MPQAKCLVQQRAFAGEHPGNHFDHVPPRS